MSHISLAVYLTLMRPAHERHHLTNIKDELAALADILAALKVYTDPIQCAVDELTSSVSADGGIVAYEAVKRFVSHLNPNFQKLVADAANDEVAQLMAVMSRIKSIVGDDEHWSQTFFVICAGNQP